MTYAIGRHGIFPPLLQVGQQGLPTTKVGCRLQGMHFTKDRGALGCQPRRCRYRFASPSGQAGGYGGGEIIRCRERVPCQPSFLFQELTKILQRPNAFDNFDRCLLIPSIL